MHAEAVVAESVVVIKKLLQLNPEAHKEIIVMMSKMASTVRTACQCLTLIITPCHSISLHEIASCISHCFVLLVTA